WMGFVLICLGEGGNFGAYAFAPPVLVAPLGSIALVGNAFIAPLFLGEPFRPRNLAGLSLVLLGTLVIIGVSTETDEPALSPDDLIKALLSSQSLVYYVVTGATCSVLWYLSYRTSIGERLIFVDLALVAIFGGYTVLSTKAISSLMSLTFVKMFTYPVTYVMFFILVLTAVIQITFLNRSLSRFDSILVIPTNFVLFTASSICASAVVFRDLSHT
ncbi:magnesium transporter, partial [Blyttiomyces helicus]